MKWRTHVFTIFTPFFTLGPGSTTLYSSHALCHGLISSTTFLQHSTTLYSLQLYSISTVYNLYNTPLPSSQRAFVGVRSLIEFEPPREQRTGFCHSLHFLVCAACAAASKARARHSAGRAGYVYCALSRCAMCACMRASRATARLVRRKSRERKGGPGRTVPPLVHY